jgi:hypothetical protein
VDPCVDYLHDHCRPAKGANRVQNLNGRDLLQARGAVPALLNAAKAAALVHTRTFVRYGPEPFRAVRPSRAVGFHTPALDDAELRRALDSHLQCVELPAHGVLLNAELARLLGVRPGDAVKRDTMLATVRPWRLMCARKQRSARGPRGWGCRAGSRPVCRARRNGLCPGQARFAPRQVSGQNRRHFAASFRGGSD